VPLTDDPNDPRVKRGPPDQKPVQQHDTYLVLSEAERAKGFVRPVRRSYVHVGIPGPKFPLRDLTDEEKERWARLGLREVRAVPARHKGSALGRYWTQAALDSVGKGCGTAHHMGQALAETYARRAGGFYGSTILLRLLDAPRVGEDGEFVWDGTDERVGT
jgi:hypothetical protein